VSINEPGVRVTPKTDYLVIPREELEKPYRVIIENDDLTPMEFVVAVLQTFFRLNLEQAIEVMLKAHHEGKAYVTTLPLREAQERVYAAHSLAHSAGYPLTFHLEPEA